MNENLRLGITGAIAVVKFGLVGSLIFWMVRRSKVFRCPRCSQWISVAHIRVAEICCTHCEWRIARAALVPEKVASAPSEPEQCEKCGVFSTQAHCVQLWDGRCYCEHCVLRADPQLLAYALSHDRLVEVNPFSFLRAFWGAICLTTIIAGMIAGLFAIIGISTMLAFVPLSWGALGRLLLAVAMMFAGGWGFIAVISFPLSFVLSWWHRPRTVEVRAGRLLIKPPGDRFYALQTIRWAEASGRFDLVECTSWPRRRGIVLFPHNGDEDDENRAAKVGYLVGLAPDMFSIWKAFLTLADVPIQSIRPWTPVPQVKNSHARPQIHR